MAGHLGELGIMADRRSLGILGFVFGSVTAAVMLIAAMVVKHHVDARAALEAQPAKVIVASAPVVVR
jgi:hypothetical protein